MNDRIEWTRHDDGVVELQLVRSDKMNALDPAMFDALIDAGTRLCSDADVRAVVMSGRGKAFCAGLDMQSFERMGDGAGTDVLGNGAAGADLLITGEASHPIYHAAKEMGMNLILAGHYQTETWGVLALARLLEGEFKIKTRFVDFPTGF